MAGSRLDRIGTIFARASGLLRSGAIKYQDRPIWYDVYRVFPPKYEPHFDREPEKTSEVPVILYKEDKPRADFFKRFGLNPSGEIRHLSDLGSEEISQAFIKSCQELEKSNPGWSPERVFETAAEAYQSTRSSYSVRSSSADSSGSVDIRSSSRSSRYGYSQPNTLDEKSDPDLEEYQQSIKRDRKIPIITAESLRSLFQEAKEKQTLEKESKTQDATGDKTKDTDKS